MRLKRIPADATLGPTVALWPFAGYGLPQPVPEYRFAPPRRWRFDYAWVPELVALEVQGGTFTGGRHSRGVSLRREYEKLNAAACLGWRVLFCLPEDVKSGAIFATVKRALGV